MPAKGYVEISMEGCKGCGLCVVHCPSKCLELNTLDTNSYGLHYAYLANEETCIACVNCAIMCPDAAITAYKKVG
ncbi:MAG: ferredoxin family protein [Candidatus Aminicenantes bacterium]|jgi:2-oxoglutarate ferredoxin oxidoreductase subunit delta|nr:ferredoxin family protein [Candidatus Aminicenantes bacterium]